VNEDGADACGVFGRIEVRIFAARPVVASEQSSAHTPTPAASNSAVGGFGKQIRLVGNETGIQTEHGSERAFDLGGRVIPCLKYANGSFNQLM
jgi:hypothetical protein